MYGHACDDWSGPCGGVEVTGRSRCSPPGCEAVVWRPSLSQDLAEQDLEGRKPKAVGEPYAGKPHVRFEVAGGGNQDLGPRRHSLTLPGDGLQPHLTSGVGRQTSDEATRVIFAWTRPAPDGIVRATIHLRVFVLLLRSPEGWTSCLLTSLPNNYMIKPHVVWRFRQRNRPTWKHGIPSRTSENTQYSVPWVRRSDSQRSTPKLRPP
jgi:hypothetical protein